MHEESKATPGSWQPRHDHRAEAAAVRALLVGYMASHDGADGLCCCDLCAVASVRVLHPIAPPTLTAAQARQWPPMEWSWPEQR